MAVPKKLHLLIGVDPGTGVSSPTGLSIIDANTMELLFVMDFTSKKKKLEHRIREITIGISDLFEDVLDPDCTVDVFIEQFVMRGKGGESLQRLIGAIMAIVPEYAELHHVQNTTVKKFLGGHGHAEKVEVVEGVLKYMYNNSGSYELIESLANENKYDILDSIAIAITGWERCKSQ